MEPKDQFYGERSASLEDDWGNQWYIATYTEDLTPEELSARAASKASRLNRQPAAATSDSETLQKLLSS